MSPAMMVRDRHHLGTKTQQRALHDGFPQGRPSDHGSVTGTLAPGAVQVQAASPPRLDRDPAKGAITPPGVLPTLHPQIPIAQRISTTTSEQCNRKRPDALSTTIAQVVDCWAEKQQDDHSPSVIGMTIHELDA